MLWTIIFILLSIFALGGATLAFLKGRNIELALKFIADVMPALEEAAKLSDNKWDDKAIAKIKVILGIKDSDE